MATQWKLTIKQGQTSQDVTQGAGTTISGSNALELNIDQDGMTQREVVVLIDELKKKVIESNWPAA